MSEQVGVLELEIRDNAQSAGDGLGHLADAVARVKQAVGKGLGLKTVGTAVINLSDQVNKAVGTSTTIKNLSSLFNAISNYSKLGDIKINVQPFKDLKEALGDKGIYMGKVGTELNQMRQALAGEWDVEKATASFAGIVTAVNEFGTNDTAKTLNETAKAMRAYSAAYEGLPSKTTKMEKVIGMFSTSIGRAAANGAKGAVQGAVDQSYNTTTYAGTFGGNDTYSYTSSIANDIGNAAESGFERVESSVQESTQAAEELNVKLVETKDKITSVLENSATPDRVVGSINQIGLAIDNLIKRLNTVTNPKGKGFSNIVDIATGVVRNTTNTGEASARTYEEYFAEQEEMARRAMEAKAEIERMISETVKVSNTDLRPFSQIVDEMTGVTGLLGKSAEDSASVFDIPARSDEFKYAQEEIEHYSERLNQARQDMEFWSKEYDKIQNQIKYNGATEERTGMLGQAEQGFYEATSRIEQYKNALDEVTNYTNKYTETTRQAAQATADMTAQVENNSNTQVKRFKVYNKETDSYVPDKPTTWEERFEEEQNYRMQHLMGTLRQFADSSREVQESIAKMYGFDVSLFGQYKAALAGANEAIEKNATVRADLKETVGGATNQRTYGKDMVEDLTNQYDKIGLMEMKLSGMKQALADDINANKADTQSIADRTMRIQELSDKLETLKNAQNEVTKGTSLLGRAWDSMKNGIKGMFPTISGLLKRFSSLVKYRMLRSVIKYITAGFSEGVENVYRYSQAVGTAFAPAMDSAKTAINQFKNSIGAAVAPVLQALIPLFNQLANTAIQVVNWINQLFALLAGQKSWTRALPVAAQAFEDQKKSAKGASAAMKDLLADWDELNIIQSQNSGGSGSGSNKAETDYASMFEEVNDFSERIKTLVDGINEQFGSIWGLAKRIGAAVLGWKVSNGFAGLLGTLGGLIASGAIIGLVFDVSTMFNKNYLRTGDIGWLIADTLTTLIGGTLVKKILSKVLGGQLATIAIPLAFAVSSIASIKALIGETDVSALSEKGILAAMNGALKGGIAAGAVLKSLGGYGLGRSVGGGIGAALFTFGATVGIKAIAEVVQNNEITADTIKSNFLAAGAIGGGIALTEMVLGGTALAALTLGGGAALFTVGALFAIEAIIASKPKGIKWGNYDATKEEIEAFVQNQLFTVHPETILELMNPVIEVADTAKKNLKTDVGKLQLTAKRIELGYDDKETMNSLMDQVNVIIADFKEYAKAQQNVIETSLTIIPVNGEEDKEAVGKIIRDTSQGWDIVNRHMENLGRSMTEHMKTAYSDGIDDFKRTEEMNTIAALTEMIANVTGAVTEGQQWAAAQRKLQDNLSNISEKSFGDILDSIEAYKEETVSAALTAYDARTDAYAGEMFSLRKVMDNITNLPDYAGKDEDYKAAEETYKRLEALYNDQVKGRDAAIKSFLSKAIDPETEQKIRDAILPKLRDFDFSNEEMPDLSNKEFYDQIISSMLTPEGNFDENLVHEKLTGLYDTILHEVLGDDFGYVKRMLDENLLSYADLFGSNMPLMVKGLRGTLKGNDEYSDLNDQFKDIWADFLGLPEIEYDFAIDDGELSGPTIDMSEMNNAMIESTGYVERFKDALYSLEHLNEFGFDLFNKPKDDSFSVLTYQGEPSGQLAQPYQPQMTGGVNLTATPGDVEISGEVDVNESKMSASVQKGMQSNTEALSNLLRQIANGISQLNDKDFSIKLEPTASAGYFWRRAGTNRNMVDGEV